MDTAFQTRHAGSVRIHVLPTAKFKTTTVTVDVLAPLSEATVTRNALVSAVLMRGSRKHPSIRALQDAVDDLYGASLDSGLFKQGERHVVQFELEVPNGKYLPHSPDLLADGLSLLAEFLLDPLTVDSGFQPQFLELEKEALRKKIEGVFNNKGRYAAKRCLEAMCQDEAYGLFSYGRLEDISDVTPQGLYQYYRDWLATSRVDVYVVGDVDPDAVSARVAEALAPLADRQVGTIPGTVIRPVPAQPREVVDRIDVNQGQLVMGYRTPVAFTSADYPRFMVYNAVLGGYAHSKLFTNVREKASLAYSAFSRFDSYKGLLLIQAGINIENYDKARTIIEEQLTAIAEGQVTDEELQQSKAMLANDYRELEDSPGQLAHFAYVQDVEGKHRPVDELIAAFEPVTVADLQAMARTVALDTVYFLRDREPVEATHA